MLMVGDSWAIVTVVKTLHGFSVTFCRLCQPLDHVHGRSTFKCISQIRELVDISQEWLVLNSGLELFPEWLPIQNVPIKGWDHNLREIDSIHHGHSSCLW